MKQKLGPNELIILCNLNIIIIIFKIFAKSNIGWSITNLESVFTTLILTKTDVIKAHSTLFLPKMDVLSTFNINFAKN